MCKKQRDKELRWEHGGETSRPFRKLSTDRSTDRRTHGLKVEFNLSIIPEEFLPVAEASETLKAINSQRPLQDLFL